MTSEARHTVGPHTDSRLCRVMALDFLLPPAVLPPGRSTGDAAAIHALNCSPAAVFAQQSVYVPAAVHDDCAHPAGDVSVTPAKASAAGYISSTTNDETQRQSYAVSGYNTGMGTGKSHEDGPASGSNSDEQDSGVDSDDGSSDSDSDSDSDLMSAGSTGS